MHLTQKSEMEMTPHDSMTKVFAPSSPVAVDHVSLLDPEFLMRTVDLMIPISLIVLLISLVFLAVQAARSSRRMEREQRVFEEQRVLDTRKLLEVQQRFEERRSSYTLGGPTVLATITETG
jgi:membrane protein implicated in regulation of membrane protease activity